MSTPIQRKIIEIGEKFDEKFGSNIYAHNAGDDYNWIYEDIKSFLNTSLLELLAAIEEELEGKKRDGQWAGIISAQEDEVYNSALSDIKQVLKLEEK